MPKSEISQQLDTICRKNRYDIERLYNVDDLTSEQVKRYIEIVHLGPGRHISLVGD
jgi:hypothetical protein